MIMNTYLTSRILLKDTIYKLNIFNICLQFNMLYLLYTKYTKYTFEIVFISLQCSYILPI